MRAQEVLGFVLASVATMFVGLRLFTRLSLAGKRLAADDYLNVAALVSAWVTTGTLRAYDDAFAAKMFNSDPAVQEEFLKWDTVWNLFFLATLCTAKLSILLFYLRLSSVRAFRYTVIALVSFITFYSVVSEIAYMLVWSPAIGTQVLENIGIIFLVYSTCNIVMDACVLILPIYLIIPLHVSTGRKISLLILFSTGALVCAAAIWRACSITFFTDAGTTIATMAKVIILGIVEGTLSILCAAIPVSCQFYTKYVPEVYKSIRTSTKDNSPASLSPSSTNMENKRMPRNKVHAVGEHAV